MAIFSRPLTRTGILYQPRQLDRSAMAAQGTSTPTLSLPKSKGMRDPSTNLVHVQTASGPQAYQAT